MVFLEHLCTLLEVASLFGLLFYPASTLSAENVSTPDSFIIRIETNRLLLFRNLQRQPKFREFPFFEVSNLVHHLDVDKAVRIHSAALEVANSRKHAHGYFDRVDFSTTAIPPHPSRPLQHATRFCPTNYGADPTGINDSTAAFQAMMEEFFNTNNTKRMASGILDLGGQTIDLQGGQYLISEPIQIPPMYGNFHIIDGTLRASAISFPADRFMIEIGDQSKCNPKLPDGSIDRQASCNEFIDVSYILLDANLIAAGGIKVEMVMGTTLTNVFVTGFSLFGIQVNRGHEVMISNAWVAACYWSDGKTCKHHAAHSIGIQINGDDHYITNAIVFSFVKVGVEIRGCCNILRGVHTWNGGGVGIRLGDTTKRWGANRLLGCYLDYSSLDLYGASGTIVESTFFLCTHTNLFRTVDGKIDGLTMRNNHFSGTEESVVVHDIFDSVSQVSIVDETFQNLKAFKTTRATKHLHQHNSTRWKFDFSTELLFPDKIDRVSYSVSSNHPSFFLHMARPPNGTTVMVETSEPVEATIVVTAEQGI